MQNKTFLLDEEELSFWSYHYCRDVKDDPGIRKNITDPQCSYLYCKNINNDPEVKKNITNSSDAYLYCKNINDDPEIRKNITDPRFLRNLENAK